jgi:hypothetical protein
VFNEGLDKHYKKKDWKTKSSSRKLTSKKCEWFSPFKNLFSLRGLDFTDPQTNPGKSQFEKNEKHGQSMMIILLDQVRRSIV